MQDLLKSYRETLYKLREVKIKADEERNKLREAAEREPTEENQSLLDRAQELCDTANAFISNVMYVVTWLSHGHAPNPRRGIHRRSREQREVLMDPLWMQSYANPSACGSPTTLSDYERFQIEDALSTLSEREKECYVLKYGMCYSLGQIASELDIQKGTVQEYIQKAEKKIIDNRMNSIFLMK